ncbi:hypothetical protein CsatA_022291 [Cannabis sativa]
MRRKKKVLRDPLDPTLDTLRYIFKLNPILSKEIDKYTSHCTDQGHIVTEGVKDQEMSYILAKHSSYD